MRFLNEVFESGRQLLPCPLINPAAQKQGQIIPKHGLGFVHHFINVLIQPWRYLGDNLFNNVLRFKFLIYRVQIAKLPKRPVNADVRHFLRFARNNTLPSDETNADKLNRVERHLYGKPVGKPAYQGGYYRHGQKCSVKQGEPRLYNCRR